MTSKVSQKITPHLWYAKEAEEAARFYASVFPDSRVDRVTPLPAESPSGPAGSVALLKGGAAEQCGWLKDQYGLSWQIVPARLGDMMVDPDPQKARRVAEAILKMVKLDIAALEAAFAGR